MEDVDSSALAQILEFISSRCALYVSVILGKPEVHPIFGGKNVLKITRQILNFIKCTLRRDDLFFFYFPGLRQLDSLKFDVEK